MPALELAEMVAAQVVASYTSVRNKQNQFVIGKVEDPPFGWQDPWLVGMTHEHSVSQQNRASRGAWYTPEPVVRGLVSLAFDAHRHRNDDLVVDPTCGGGAFLLAALDELVVKGVSPEQAIVSVSGMDIDHGAAAVSRLSLHCWAASHQLACDSKQLHIFVGDALQTMPEVWQQRRIIVGNPPFASPLHAGALNETAAAFHQANSSDLGMYADLASMHLLRAVQTSPAGSTVAMVQPQSVLSSRDLAQFRTNVEKTAPLQSLWVAKEPVFDAGVRACAPVLGVGSQSPAGIQLASKPTVERGSFSSSDGWSSLAADALGAPPLPKALHAAKTRLGEMASATAGFRDEYYGLVEGCYESDGEVEPPNRLMTVGSVDPLWSHWGQTQLRFGGDKWLKPAVRYDQLADKLQRWVTRQSQPKILLATQAKVLEPYVDREGSAIPVTPLLSVHCDKDDLYKVAAVLLAPPVALWAWRTWFGSAMAVDAIKLSAKQVLQIPLPVNGDKWQEAAAVVESNQSGSSQGAWAVAKEVAAIMNQAYDGDSQVLDWWLSRCKA